MNIRIGVISVGGKGLRFGRVDIQKCLVQIEGRHLVEYTIETFARAGVKMIFLLTGFLQEQVNAYIQYRDREEGPELIPVFGGIEGEVSAILKLRSLLNEDFLYAGGDCIFPASSVKKLVADASRAKRSIAVAAASPNVDSAPEHPRIVLFKRTRRIKEILSPERPDVPKLTVTGMYYFRPSAFDIFSRVGSDSRHTSDFVKYAVENGQNVSTSITTDPWFCFHTQEDVRRWQNSDMKGYLEKG